MLDTITVIEVFSWNTFTAAGVNQVASEWHYNLYRCIHVSVCRMRGSHDGITMER